MRTIFLVLFHFFCQGTLADSTGKEKSITIEWEPVAGSFGYEVEVTQKSRAGNFIPFRKSKEKSTSWTSSLSPGKYQLRIRSLDARGVPGVWGEFIPFSVLAPAPNLLKPNDSIELKSSKDDEVDVEFEWAPMDGVPVYLVEIFFSNGTLAKKIEAETAKVKVKLPVANKFQWQVHSLDVDKNIGESAKQKWNFSLIGKKIKKPKIEMPESEFETQVKWEKPKYAEKFQYILYRKKGNNKLELLEKNLNYKDTFININTSLPGGIYQLQVKALGNLRINSDIDAIDFPVYDGDRSPEGLETARLRRALEQDKDHYLFATYLISSLSYNGDNKETANQLKYNVLAGTGRLGYGFMPKSKWGFLSTLDLGGVNISNKNYTFASLELQRIWRTYLGRATQLRLYGGIFVKEIPEAKSFDSTDLTVKNVQMMGPLLGMQFWTSFSYRYGLQINAQTNYSLLKLSTPNNKELIPTPSYQLGAMGSYKFKENLTGFAGLAYRVDQVKYYAKPYVDGGDLSFASEGDVNTVNMTGVYLNLYAEWGF